MSNEHVHESDRSCRLCYCIEVINDEGDVSPCTLVIAAIFIAFGVGMTKLAMDFFTM